MVNLLPIFQKVGNLKGIRIRVALVGLVTVLPPIFATQKAVAQPAKIWYKMHRM